MCEQFRKYIYIQNYPFLLCLRASAIKANIILYLPNKYVAKTRQRNVVCATSLKQPPISFQDFSHEYMREQELLYMYITYNMCAICARTIARGHMKKNLCDVLCAYVHICDACYHMMRKQRRPSRDQNNIIISCVYSTVLQAWYCMARKNCVQRALFVPSSPRRRRDDA